MEKNFSTRILPLTVLILVLAKVVNANNLRGEVETGETHQGRSVGAKE